jgi:hypothetical protein
MYVELESLRFDGSFYYQITVDENLSNDVVLTQKRICFGNTERDRVLRS